MFAFDASISSKIPDVKQSANSQFLKNVMLFELEFNSEFLTTIIFLLIYYHQKEFFI